MEVFLINVYLNKLSAPVDEVVSGKRNVMSEKIVVPLELLTTTNKHGIGGKDFHDDKTTVSTKFKSSDEITETKSEFGYVMATGYYDQITAHLSI